MLLKHELPRKFGRVINQLCEQLSFTDAQMYIYFS